MKSEKKIKKQLNNQPNKKTFHKKYWLIASLLACLTIVAFTALPIFKNPQLEPDDYRYLHRVQLLDQNFWGNISEASVVENRWDHLWWIDIKENVRFFRPAVVLSYWLDVKMYGSHYPLGLLITNILIYAACVILVCLIFYQWLGPGLPFLASSALFASFYAHGEVMWYVAGRTDSLAAFFLLCGFALHIYGKKRPPFRWWAIPFFTLAAFTKELTLVLPGILFLHDWWIEKREIDVPSLIKREWALYAVYVIIAVVVLWVRSAITSGVDTGYPYPYFVTLGHPDFLSHLFGQMKSYCANLLFATETLSLIPPEFLALVSPEGLILGIIMFSFYTFFLYKEKKYWLLLFVALAFWIPTIIVYISERYLFLPSFALAGVTGVLLSRLNERNKQFFYAALLVVVVWTGHQAYSLGKKNLLRAASPRRTQIMESQLKDIKPFIPKGAHLLVVNLPGPTLQAQFLKEQLRVQLDDPLLEVTVLTMMPHRQDMGAELNVKKVGENSVLLENASHGPVMAPSSDVFPWVTLGTSQKYVLKSGIDVEILKGRGYICQAIRFVLPELAGKYLVLKWNPGDPHEYFSPYDRDVHSQVELVRP